jgi:hypothetical protein
LFGINNFYFAFLGEPILASLFTKFNTPVPSSAAVERLFSIGKDILRAKRASLSDENFEMLMFLKGSVSDPGGSYAICFTDLDPIVLSMDHYGI